MGPNQSQNKNNNPPTLEEHLQIAHPRFSSLKVISPPTEEEQGVIEINISLPNENQFKKWDKNLRQLGQSETIYLPVGQSFQKTQFCGSGGIAHAQYKYYPYLLSDQIVNRSNMEGGGKVFQQPQLWYLVYAVLEAATVFHRRGSKLGDIRPQNVFISPDGQVKVASTFTWPNQQTNYQKTIFDKQITYLAPEELKDINYGKLQQNTNHALSQSFSIGLTCLDAASLSQSTPLYLTNSRFNYNQLQQRINKLQAQRLYSEPLLLLIKGLCQTEPQRRVTAAQLSIWLTKYEQDIIQLSQFKILQLPDKLKALKFQQNIYQQTRNSHQVRQNMNPPYNQQNVNPQFIPSQNINPSYMQPQNNVVHYQNINNQPANSQPVNIQPVYQPPVVHNGANVQFNPINKPVYQGQPLNSQTNYVHNVNMVQSLYSQYNPHNGLIRRQQNDGQTSGVNVVKDYRGTLNLQQIDQQLQMSRKLFPS